jgi:hypothetical protein
MQTQINEPFHSTYSVLILAIPFETIEMPLEATANRLVYS